MVTLGALAAAIIAPQVYMASYVKVLHRRPAASPIAAALGHGAAPSIVSSLAALKDKLGEVAASALATRKSADGGPLSFIERVREFIARNGPDIDLSFVVSALSGLKTPIMVTLGVAAVAGLVYLAYRLYKHFTEAKAGSAVDTIMADLQSVAPDLFTVPGWAESLADQVHAAVESGPTEMVKRVAEIKADLINKQHKTDPSRVGSGIDYFRAHRGRKGRGGGMIAV